jgi:hypothetical protein
VRKAAEAKEGMAVEPVCGELCSRTEGPANREKYREVKFFDALAQPTPRIPPSLDSIVLFRTGNNRELLGNDLEGVQPWLELAGNPVDP